MRLRALSFPAGRIRCVRVAAHNSRRLRRAWRRVLLAGLVLMTEAVQSAEPGAPASTGEALSGSGVEITGLAPDDQALARELIAERLKLIAEKGLTPPRADDAAFFLERGLRRAGFRNPEVDWSIRGGGTNLLLEVHEEGRLFVGTLTFPGAPKSDHAALQQTILSASGGGTPGRRGLSLTGGPVPYVESGVSAGIDSIAGYYQSKGYWKATAGPPEVSVRESDQRVDLAIPVQTGSLFTLGDFRFEGELGIAEARLRAAVQALAGKDATSDNLFEARRIVAAIYSDEGYYRFEMEVNPVDRGSLMDLHFDIKSGNPYTVERVIIEDSGNVDRDFLRKRFSPLAGVLYRPADAVRVQRELLGAGLFSQLSIQPEVTGEGILDLHVRSQEAKTKEIGFYGGYGNFDGAILGVSFRERNLFRKGRLLGLDAEINQRGVLGQVQYRNPWFLDGRFPLDMQLYARNRDLLGYDKNEIGFLASLRRQVTPHYEVSMYANPAYASISDAGIPPDELGEQKYFVNLIGMKHVYDRRDNSTLPSRGWIAEGTTEYASSAIGSEIDFFRGDIRLSAYVPLPAKILLSLGARSGVIIPAGDTQEIPIDLRFFSGGSTSVRSFRERRMPPLASSGDPLGGQFYNTFNVECTRPIKSALRGAVFFDAGNLGVDDSDFGLGDMHYAAGIGLRLDLPTGPIRADYGWNLNRGENEPSGAFHFTMGISF